MQLDRSDPLQLPFEGGEALQFPLRDFERVDPELGVKIRVLQFVAEFLPDQAAALIAAADEEDDLVVRPGPLEAFPAEVVDRPANGGRPVRPAARLLFLRHLGDRFGVPIVEPDDRFGRFAAGAAGTPQRQADAFVVDDVLVDRLGGDIELGGLAEVRPHP